MPISVRSRRSGVVVARAVEAAKTMSPSAGPNAGRMASAMPPEAMIARRVAEPLVSGASVATTISVVLAG